MAARVNSGVGVRTTIFSFKLRERENVCDTSAVPPVLFILDYFIDGKSRAE